MALIHCNFFSETLGLSTSMDVILPEQAAGQIGMDNAVSGAEHPCLYLLHGLSDDHTIWQRRTSIERYAAPLGLAVVMPTVHRGFYCDMAYGYDYWTFIHEEVPAKAKSLFRISDRREDTFVAGLSMGGFGAFKLALNCPEQFAAAASLSGAVDMIARRRSSEGERSRENRLVFGETADITGTLDDLGHVATTLAASESTCPLLYQWCGTEDFLYEENIAFRDRVALLGLPLTYEEGPGGHEWACWDQQIQRVLEWLPIQVTMCQ